jgi:hypothetical protein
MPRAARKPPVDMIRDAAITALGAEAVQAGALVAAIIYETADGRIAAVSHDGTKSTVHGLLLRACKAEKVEVSA